MNFDMNVFMNALQAGFGTGNTVKTQAAKTQQEEFLFEDVKPAAKNQTQQPQIAQDQQTMGFFAMVGMMFLGFLSLFGFGNNANNNANNNVDNTANNTTAPAANDGLAEAVGADGWETLRPDELANNSNSGHEEKLFDTEEAKTAAKSREMQNQRNIANFKPKGPNAVKYLSIEEVQSTDIKKLAGKKNYNSTKIAYEPGKVYYEGSDGKIHVEWGDAKAKELTEKAEKSAKEFNNYKSKHPNSTLQNDAKYKALYEAADSAHRNCTQYTVTSYYGQFPILPTVIA